jgi:formate-dependent nitrite reductase membrane component NrfD
VERVSDERDMTPAVGSHGGPAFGRRTGEKVALHIGEWRDGRWSYLYDKGETHYADVASPDGDVPAAARRAREGELTDDAIVQGPVMKPSVWTWEVPLYFWFGGIAAGSSFVALACDLSGDEHSARIARKVALGALIPSPPLLIMDLGRPGRFYNMLRVFKPRSPMNMGAWALTLFGNLAAASVGADLLGRRRAARAIGAANAVVGGYLGSYAGVLLASTAVPVWARSRLFLGPIFVCTATATGAATCRLVLVGLGLPEGHQTREALGRVETGAMTAELLLSTLNERQLGPLAKGLESGTSGRLFKAAKWSVRAGLGLRFARGRGGPWTHHLASVLYLVAGLLFRYGWVGAGPPSARDDRVVAQMARSKRHGH